MFVVTWRNWKKGILYGVSFVLAFAASIYGFIVYAEDSSNGVLILAVLAGAATPVLLTMAAYHLSIKKIEFLSDRLYMDMGKVFLFSHTVMRNRYILMDISDLFEEFVGPAGERVIPYSEIVSVTVRDDDEKRVMYIERNSPLKGTYSSRIYERDVGKRRFDAIVREMKRISSDMRIPFENRSAYEQMTRSEMKIYEMK